MILRNFAVIEGCDGSGTSTQLEMLKSRFDSASVVLFASCEPTQSPLGLLIRRILGKEIRVQRETLARLFAADRGEHLYAPGGIVECCGQGALAVSDRYTPSSLVYQGLECGRKLPELLNDSFPLPELLIYLDIDSQTAMERITKRNGGKEREIYEKPDFQTKVREAYLGLLPRYKRAGVRVVSIDGTLAQEEVSEEIWRVVREMPIMQGKV
jgi:dTMP kinase